MQKITLLSGVAALALAAAFGTPAVAADLPAKGRAVTSAPVVAAPISFAGFYIGGHVGYGTSTFRGFTSSLDFDRFIHPKGFLLGLQAGYNWQANQLVYGVEGDLTWTPWGKKYAFDCSSCTESGQVGQLRGLASIRGRLGWAIDRTLFYGTGGIAWAAKRSAANSSDVFHPESNIKFGWVAGGGLEYKINPGLSLRAEGLYYRFDESRKDPIAVANFQPTARHGIQNATVGRIGLNWFY